MYSLQDFVNAIRSLPIAVPSSSMIVERNFRKRLVQTLEATIPTVKELKATLLKSDIFASNHQSDTTTLTSRQFTELADAIATHSSPMYYVKPDTALEPISHDSVIENVLRAIVATPEPVRAKEHHLDSLEVAARLLRAEALLVELESLIVPVVNNVEEREPVDNAIRKLRKITKSLWPLKHEEVAEKARSERRAEWVASLHDIVSYHWNSAATQNNTKAPTKERLGVVTANITKVLGVSEPPSPTRLKRL